MRISRRAFLKTTLGATAGAGLVYPTVIEPWKLAIEKISIGLPALPAAFAGFKIVQLSDLHFQPFTTLRQIQHVVAVTNFLKPDLVLITGDFVTNGTGAMHILAPELAKIRSSYGVIGCLGNHDRRGGGNSVADSLRASGIEMLINEGRTFSHRGAEIFLAGIDSVCNGSPDLRAALATRPPGMTTILLAHEPDFADTILPSAAVHLQLSGHSHGGQVCLPFIGPPFLPDWGRKYWHGLQTVGTTQVYTNRGIGTIGLPVRLGSKPEITEITLQLVSLSS